MQPTITLNSGGLFNFAQPSESQFTIEDIAHGLSHLCRFTGQVNTFYSVAQHSYHVSTLVPKEHALAGLLHDAAEAFLGDVASPLKQLLPDYQTIERRVEACVLARFGLATELPACIKVADREMLRVEMQQRMPRLPANYFQTNGLARQDIFLADWSPAMAKAFFLARFEELTA